MLKKGLAILLTAITLAGVVTPSVSVQAYARPYTNTENKNLKDCIEHTDMNVIHSLETDKVVYDNTVKYNENVQFSKKNQFGKGRTDSFGKKFTEKVGYIDISEVNVDVASNVMNKLINKKRICLYTRTGNLQSSILSKFNVS